MGFYDDFVYMWIMKLKRIAGLIFLSIISISMTCIIFILVAFFVTDWSGVQEHVGECILASAIVNSGWFHQS
jgi:hypothetical protein